MVGISLRLRIRSVVGHTVIPDRVEPDVAGACSNIPSVRCRGSTREHRKAGR
jgi:hypothetical protein